MADTWTATQNAAILSSFGGASALVVTRNQPIPACGDYQIRIRVRSCALSVQDIKVCAGAPEYLPVLPGARLKPGVGYFHESDATSAPSDTHPSASLDSPLIPGYAIAGDVDATGSAVQHVRIGDPVVALLSLAQPLGGCAQYTVCDAVNVLTRPRAISADVAAAVIAEGVRAYTQLHMQLRMKPDDFVLFVGGPRGGVDSLAVQLASLYGARVLVAVRDAAELNAFAHLSERIVRIIDTSRESLEQAVFQETDGMGVQCIIDSQYWLPLSTTGQVQTTYASFVPSTTAAPAAAAPTAPTAPSKEAQTVPSTPAQPVASTASVSATPRTSVTTGTATSTTGMTPASFFQSLQAASGPPSNKSVTSSAPPSNSGNSNPAPASASKANPASFFQSLLSAPPSGKGAAVPAPQSGSRPSSANSATAAPATASASASASTTPTLRSPVLAAAQPPVAPLPAQVQSAPTPLVPLLVPLYVDAPYSYSLGALGELMAPFGRIVTNHPRLQLDPPVAQSLMLRGVSISFCFEPLWLLAPTQHSVYLHILKEVLDRAARGELQPVLAPVSFTLDKIHHAMRHVEAARPATVIVHP